MNLGSLTVFRALSMRSIADPQDVIVRSRTNAPPPRSGVFLGERALRPSISAETQTLLANLIVRLRSATVSVDFNSPGPWNPHASIQDARP